MKTKDVNAKINELAKSTIFKLGAEILKPFRANLKALEPELGRAFTKEEIASIIGQVLQQAHGNMIHGQGREVIIDGTNLVTVISVEDFKEEELSDKPA